MRLQFNTKALLAFIILMFLLHEVHELAHHLAGAILSGCWGTRDFLLWKPCNDSLCIQIIAGFAGPLITYGFMWAGFFLLKKTHTISQKRMGFILVMASLPLPRILGVVARGGDEIYNMRLVLMNKGYFKELPVIAGGLIVLILTIPPLWRAFRSIQNKQRILIFLALLVLPWLLDMFILTKLLHEQVAPTGFLMKPVLLGTPLLVIAWEVLLLISFLISRKYLKEWTQSMQ